MVEDGASGEARDPNETGILAPEWQERLRMYGELGKRYLDLELLSLSRPNLARELAERVVDRFLSGARLNVAHRDEAITQTVFRVGLDSAGQPNRLMVTLPLGSGNPGFDWDGSETAGAVIADNAADRGIEDVMWDQENVGPTGWE